MNKFSWAFPDIYEAANAYRFLIAELKLNPMKVKVEQHKDFEGFSIVVESEEPTAALFMSAICQYVYERARK
jgi:hypothetical protein